MELIVEQNRIYGQSAQGDLLAEVLFPEADEGVVSITHTFVNESLRGKGVADQLMKTLATELQAQSIQAIAVCPYAAQWFEKHPEYSNLLVSD